MTQAPSPGRSSTMPTGRWSFLVSNSATPLGLLALWQRCSSALLLLVALWLALRTRHWPADSQSDWGGAGLVAFACLLSGSTLFQGPRVRRSLLIWPLPIAIALLLIGHVGTQSAVGLNTLAACSTVLVLAWLASSASGIEPTSSFASARPHETDNSRSISVESPNSTDNTANDSANQLDSAATELHQQPVDDQKPLPQASQTLVTESLSHRHHEPTSAQTTSDYPHNDLTTQHRNSFNPGEHLGHESLGDDESDWDETEEDEAEDLTGVSQSWRRWSDETGERIEGYLRVNFAPGEMTTWVHLPFWPPLEQVPKVEVHLASDEARAKVAATENFGVRIELRLQRPCSSDLDIPLHFAIRSSK